MYLHSDFLGKPVAHSLPPLQLKVKLPLTWLKTSWRLHLTQEFWEEKFGFAVHGWTRLQNHANNTNHKEAWAAALAFQLGFCFNTWKGCKLLSWLKFSAHKARIQCSFSVCEHTYWCSGLYGLPWSLLKIFPAPSLSLGWKPWGPW